MKTPLPFTCLSTLLLLAANSTSLYAASQDGVVLDRLVFDPVLLEEDQTGALVEVRPAGTGQFADPAIESLSAPERVNAPFLPELSIAEYEYRINDTLNEVGIYSPEVIQDLMSLGYLYQAQGQHRQALEIFAQADHISRVNFGLYHPSNIPVVEAMIDSHLALGEPEVALDRQQYLFLLNQKITGDNSTESLSMLMSLGDRHMDKFNYTMFSREGRRNLRTSAQAGLGSGEPSIARQFAIGDLYRAKNRYFEAISTILENEMYFHPELIDMEYKFLETLFLLGYGAELVMDPHYYLARARKFSNTLSRWGFLRRNSPGYATGRDAHERILAYLENDPSATAGERVEALLAFGDWHLLFGRRDAANEQYEAGYALAVDLGMPEADLTRYFSPVLPVQLPLITPKPNSRELFGIGADVPLDYAGHVDMRFTINSNGTATRIRLLDSDAGTSDLVKRRLREYLRNAPFRPYLEDGETLGSVPVTVRYYYAFLPE